jgi:medium-chain acyl-[acyl-carrier-protein] hydrolase
VEVIPVQLPGREGRLREPPLTRVAPIVEAVARDMQPYLDRPFAFFGHSMGAVLAFELARHLRRGQGREPARLFVSGRRAPQLAEDESCSFGLPEPEFIEELRRLNGTPPEVLEHAELMQLMIPVLRSDFEVCQTYRHVPDAPLRCPVAAFGGLRDASVTREALEGWRQHTAAGFTLRMLPGDHFFLNSNRPRLLEALSDELDGLARMAA